MLNLRSYIRSDRDAVLNQLSPDKKYRLIGEIVSLMAASAIHRQFPIVDLTEIILPPVDLNQFRIYHDKANRPVGFVTWGLFSDDVFTQYKDGRTIFSHADWQSGDILVFTDFVAPFGHANSIVRDLRDHVFKDHKEGFSLRFTERGKPRGRVNRWMNKR